MLQLLKVGCRRLTKLTSHYTRPSSKQGARWNADWLQKIGFQAGQLNFRVSNTALGNCAQIMLFCSRSVTPQVTYSQKLSQLAKLTWPTWNIFVFFSCSLDTMASVFFLQVDTTQIPDKQSSELAKRSNDLYTINREK